jgi:hypothetical protein
MNVLHNMQLELNELVRLVRLSERYCTSVAAKPELASTQSHASELERELRIAEISRRYGITS